MFVSDAVVFGAVRAGELFNPFQGVVAALWAEDALRVGSDGFARREPTGRVVVGLQLQALSQMRDEARPSGTDAGLFRDILSPISLQHRRSRPKKHPEFWIGQMEMR